MSGGNRRGNFELEILTHAHARGRQHHFFVTSDSFSRAEDLIIKACVLFNCRHAVVGDGLRSPSSAFALLAAAFAFALLVLNNRCLWYNLALKWRIGAVSWIEAFGALMNHPLWAKGSRAGSILISLAECMIATVVREGTAAVHCVVSS